MQVSKKVEKLQNESLGCALLPILFYPPVIMAQWKISLIHCLDMCCLIMIWYWKNTPAHSITLDPEIFSLSGMNWSSKLHYWPQQINFILKTLEYSINNQIYHRV